MEGVRSCNTSAAPGAYLSNSPGCQLDQPAPYDWLTSVVYLASGNALQLPLDGFDLVLEPQPTSILQVSLQGHTVLVVPEGLPGSAWPGHPDFSPSNPLGSALADVPRELIVIDPGLFGALGQVPHCLSPSFSPSAEGCDPRSSSSHKGSMMSPLPDSPLQPLPPPPPRSPEEQLPLRPRNPSRPPCKARRRLF